jgi:phosphate transport system substrate-binding protein
MKHAFCLLSAALTSAAFVPSALADTVRLSGSPAVIAAVINPHRAAVERATGHTLEVVSSETGQGMADLADQKADVAMVSERIDAAVAAAGRAGKRIHPSALWVHELQKDEVVFLVHASNPVGKLSMAQLSDIHTGKIGNWKQVGGPDRRITVYAGSLNGATSGVVRTVVMGGANYRDGIRSMTSMVPVSELVQADESAIGAVNKALVPAGASARAVDTPRVSRQLSLITVGAPAQPVARVIDALKRAAAGQLGPDTVLVAK